MLSEKEKMLAGQPYRAFDEELKADRATARAILRRFNAVNCSEINRCLLMKELFGVIGANTIVTPVFQCDYGFNIKLGHNVFVNRDCVFFDCGTIEIGNNVQIAPGVQIYTATDALSNDRNGHNERNGHGDKSALPVRIGNNVFIGAGVIILPGVTIEHDAIIAAGCVVKNNVPENAIVAGRS